MRKGRCPQQKSPKTATAASYRNDIKSSSRYGRPLHAHQPMAQGHGRSPVWGTWGPGERQGLTLAGRTGPGRAGPRWRWLGGRSSPGARRGGGGGQRGGGVAGAEGGGRRLGGGGRRGGERGQAQQQQRRQQEAAAEAGRRHPRAAPRPGRPRRRPGPSVRGREAAAAGSPARLPQNRPAVRGRRLAPVTRFSSSRISTSFWYICGRGAAVSTPRPRECAAGRCFPPGCDLRRAPHAFPSATASPYLLPLGFGIVLVAKQVAQSVGCRHLSEEARTSDMCDERNPSNSPSPAQTAPAPKPAPHKPGCEG